MPGWLSAYLRTLAGWRWGHAVEVERRNRIRLAVAAYAYEVENASIMSDGEFDDLSCQIDPSILTGCRDLDEFFATKFDPSTGSWIHTHPGLEEIRRLYYAVYRPPVPAPEGA